MLRTMLQHLPSPLPRPLPQLLAAGLRGHRYSREYEPAQRFHQGDQSY